MNIPEISSYYPPFANQNRPNTINPVIPPSSINTSYIPKREVEYVSGFDGANNVLMGPSSSALYLDKDMNVLWVVATDQNGAKSVVKGYNIGDEYVPPKAVTLEDLMEQMHNLNDRLNKMEEGQSYGKYNLKPAGQSKPSGTSSATGSRDV